MIRLKTLLEQSTKKIPNVLFVTDNAEDRRKGFAKQLITNSQVTGDIRTVDKGSLAQLKDALSVAISSYYDLVVVITRGIYEPNKNPVYGLTILESIKNICKTANIPLVLNTIPSVQFIKPEFAKKINFTLANDAEFDRFIQQTADYVLDTSIFNDDSFFNKTGIYLNRQSHERLYNEMINILNDLNSADDTIYDVGQTEKIIAEPGSKGRHVRALQQRLIEFGYKINEFELKNQKFGESTEAAIITFKMKHGLNADAVLDKQTINKLKTEIPDKITKVIVKKPEIKFAGNVIKPSVEDIKFYSEILKGIDAPVTKNTLTFFFAWRKAEHGACAFNPFATTQPYGASTKFNTAGVRNYQSEEDGIAATIKTLLNGYYTDLVNRLRSDLDPIEIASSLDLNIWGSHQLPLKVLTGGSVNPPEIVRTTQRTIDNEVDDADTDSGSDSSMLGLLGLGLSGVIGTEIFGTGAGRLIGNKGGGDGGDWAGSLPKLISILPAGNWKASSQKRSTVLSRSGLQSDHHNARTDSYAGDFGLNSTFGGDTAKATQFAIAIAQNAGKDIDSWEPYVGKVLNIDSGDHRVQIIWQSNVGGNHWDHVHVGVRKR
jgi:peptidoglycan hydrolase-like protein with peptidoglycan-binding domain